MILELHRWLATRAALKNECAGQPFSVKRVASPPLVPVVRETAVRTGSPYWYLDGTTAKRALFGNRSLHTSRLEDGNFYETREDARLKRNPIKLECAK